MTIEFRCPYCAAPIQVADQAAGSTGRCPRCAAKVPVPRPAGLTPSKPEPPALPPKQEPAPETVPTVVTESAAEFVSPAALVKRRARRPQGVPLLIPILGVVVLGGVVGWFAWRDWDSRQLKGELPAMELSDVDLQPVILPRSQIDAPPKDREDALRDLEATPLPMISDLMQVQFRGGKEGLVISVSRGAKSVWYRVDVRRHAVLASYLDQNAAALEARRTAELSSAATGFIQQFQAVARKEAPEASLRAYRDRLGLTALVRGLGHQVVAVVGYTLYPCVYEESNGALYFLLPANLKQFELTGRRLADGKAPFEGHFTVQVRGAPFSRDPAGSAPPDPAERLPLDRG